MEFAGSSSHPEGLAPSAQKHPEGLEPSAQNCLKIKKKLVKLYMQLGQLIMQEGITICLFLTYQAFKNREVILFRKILTEGLK